MRNIINNLFAAALLLGLAACSQSEDFIVPASDTVSLSTTISPMEKPTRADISGNGSGQFTENDRISLLVTPEGAASSQSMTLVLTGGKWTPALSWADLGASKARFHAIWPARQDLSGGRFIHEVSPDQSIPDNYTASDLLMASASGSHGQTVTLDFRHAMAGIALQLSSSKTFSAAQLAAAEVSVLAYGRMEVDGLSGTLGQVSGEISSIRFRNEGNGAFSAVVCPQEINAAWREESWMEIKINGKTYSYKAPQKLKDGSPFRKLESGKRLALAINLDKGEVEPDWRNRTAWVHGITPPPLEQWGLAFETPEKTPGLEWQPGCGWYDCNKKDPVSGTYGDNNLCWAATCSNLIYWWIDHNRENLQRYGYRGPQTYNHSLDCDVFEYFKSHFTNKGCYVQKGLNWFFRGIPVHGGNDDASSHGNHPGFFTDVFSGPNFKTASGYHLSEDLKYAFMNKEAIGLNIMVKAGTGAHAINIWGAEFDGNGEVCKIYIVENNDMDIVSQGVSPMQPGRLCPTGIYPKRVKKSANGEYYMESSSPGKYTILINEIYFLGTNEQEWKDYFSRK